MHKNIQKSSQMFSMWLNTTPFRDAFPSSWHTPTRLASNSPGVWTTSVGYYCAHITATTTTIIILSHTVLRWCWRGSHGAYRLSEATWALYEKNEFHSKMRSPPLQKRKKWPPLTKWLIAQIKFQYGTFVGASRMPLVNRMLTLLQTVIWKIWAFLVHF